jgi:hypothetical protein
MSEELDNLRALLSQLYADKYTLDERIQEIELLIDNLERGQKNYEQRERDDDAGSTGRLGKADYT